MRSMGSIWKATLRAMALLIGRVSPKGNERGSDREGVGDIARPGERRRQHHVKSDVMAGKVGVTGKPILCRAHDAAPLPGWQRPGGVLLGLPALDLDESQPPAFERHEVNLADRRLVALRHDAVAFEPKQKRSQGLGE